MEHEQIHHPSNLHLLHLTMLQILFFDAGWQNVLRDMLQMHHNLLFLLVLLDIIQSFIFKQDL